MLDGSILYARPPWSHPREDDMVPMELERHRWEFQDQGFTVCRRFFSTDEVAATVQAIEEARPRHTVPSPQ